MKRVIIDTDPGIDDAAAILMTLGSPELDIEAMTTVFGNTPVENCTINALRILEAADRTEIPVYEGSSRPYNCAEPVFAALIHGDDGLGDAGVPMPSTAAQPTNAVIELINRVMTSPGEITVMAIGRLTNVALAMAVEPGFTEAVGEVIVMGGAVSVPGNASPTASANLRGDPEAADVVYRSGANVVQIGLDVCEQVEISLAQQEELWAADTKATRFMHLVSPFIQAAYERRGRLHHPGGVRYNDMPAVSYGIFPELFECRELPVHIEIHGEHTRGMTVANQREDPGEPTTAKVAFGVDAARLTQLWVERVAAV
ncbi:MAG: nucleoside hydrolase [SAR202 cluster bacterium]|nr:nucleoside hydrolase [SAR202 cluster bacterium]